MCCFGLCLVIATRRGASYACFVLNVVGDTCFGVQLICVYYAFLSTVVNARCNLKGAELLI